MKLTRKAAIRAKCLDCCCNQANEVRLCPTQNCALWPFRLGKAPSGRVLSPAQKAALKSRGFGAGKATRTEPLTG